MSDYYWMFDLKLKQVTVTYISWFSDFAFIALYLEDYLMFEHYILG